MALTSNTYALLIGINDYSRFDASVGNGAGASDLRGAVEDVRSWLSLCEYFLVPGENIRVHTSPGLDSDELPDGAEAGLADGAGIQAGLEWLRSRLQADPGAAGILFMGGHAIFELGRGTGPQAGFGPSDMTGTVDGDEIDYQGLIDLVALKESFGDAAENLSSFFDFCNSPNLPDVVTRVQRRVGRLTGRWPGVGSRLLSATEPGQASRELVLDGRWQGAFTWAVRNVLMQWDVFLEQGVVRSTMAYGRLVRAVNAVLNGLGYEQDAVFSGAPARLAVFQPGLEVDLSGLSGDPDARHGCRQIDAGTGDGFRIIQFDLGTGNPSPSLTPTLGMIIVTKTASPSGNYDANCEYFRFDQTKLDDMASQGFTTFVLDCNWDVARPASQGGLQELFDLVTWQPPNENSWAFNRVVFSDTTTSGSYQAPAIFRFGKPGAQVDMQMDFSGNYSTQPLLIWLQSTDDGLVFFDVNAANLKTTGGPPYLQRFNGSTKMPGSLVPQGGAAGWQSYSSVNVENVSNVLP